MDHENVPKENPRDIDLLVALGSASRIANPASATNSRSSFTSSKQTFNAQAATIEARINARPRRRRVYSRQRGQRLSLRCGRTVERFPFHLRLSIWTKCGGSCCV